MSLCSVIGGRQKEKLVQCALTLLRHNLVPRVSLLPVPSPLSRSSIPLHGNKRDPGNEVGSNTPTRQTHAIYSTNQEQNQNQSTKTRIFGWKFERYTGQPEIRLRSQANRNDSPRSVSARFERKTRTSRAGKGWAKKRAVRFSSDVWWGEGLARALFPRFRCVW